MTKPKAKIKAVAYARVSSKEQEREGYSIDAQLKLLRGYAEEKGFDIVHEFVDAESASSKGRENFGKVVSLFEQEQKLSPEARCRVILVEKTDRLYRNFYDWVKLDPDQTDIEIHFVKEGIEISRESKSNDKFIHSIKVLMAKNYSDNLSEETKKGLREKAAQGMWPSFAPLGYTNVLGPNGKKVMVPDPERARHVMRLFEDYATGRYSLLDLSKKAYDDGFRTRKGRKVVRSMVQKLLRNRIYTGDFVYDGTFYKGSYEPLISVELWQRVQDILEGKNKSKLRKGRRDWAFARMIRCGHCGCSMIAEMQKGKYIYYHCTGYKNEHKIEYVREETFEEQFAEMLRDIQVPKVVLDWIAEALRQSHEDEQRYHRETLKDLQAKYDRLQKTVHVLYDDKLEGTITPEFFLEKAEMIRVEQEEILRSIERHQQADQQYLELGVEILELAARAYDLFVKQPAKEKRRLLDFLLSNCTFKDGQLKADFKQPFDILAKLTHEARQKKAAGELSDDLFDNWLPV